MRLAINEAKSLCYMIALIFIGDSMDSIAIEKVLWIAISLLFLVFNNSYI